MKGTPDDFYKENGRAARRLRQFWLPQSFMVEQEGMALVCLVEGGQVNPKQQHMKTIEIKDLAQQLNKANADKEHLATELERLERGGGAVHPPHFPLPKGQPPAKGGGKGSFPLAGVELVLDVLE